MTTKALSDQSLSLYLCLSSYLALSLLFCEFECFAQLAALRPIQLVLCHAVPFFLMLAFQMSQTISLEALDVVFWPANSGLHRRSLTLNRSSVTVCSSFCLLVGFTLCLCLPFCLSLSVFMEMCRLASSSLVYSIRPPPLLSSLLPSQRFRLIAGVELYIQVNSWDGWPLLNAYVVCLYRIHSLLLHSEHGHGCTLWVR